MTTKVSICNDAILACGSPKFIADLDTERTAEARACKQAYDKARLAALEDFDWTFAKGRKALATTVEDPPSDWGYRYAYPAGIVKMRGIVNPAGDNAPAIPYELETTGDGTSKCILTDEPDAVARVTQNITNPGQFSSLFADAVALQIALRICFTLTGKPSLVEKLRGSYRDVLEKAQAADSGERGERQAADAPWIAGR